MPEVVCPNCKHPVGEPLDPKAPLDKKIKITERYLMICAKCFEFTRGTKDGNLRILDSKERATVLLFKPETMAYLRAAWMASPEMRNSAN